MVLTVLLWVLIGLLLLVGGSGVVAPASPTPSLPHPAPPSFQLRTRMLEKAQFRMWSRLRSLVIIGAIVAAFVTYIVVRGVMQPRSTVGPHALCLSNHDPHSLWSTPVHRPANPCLPVDLSSCPALRSGSIFLDAAM